MAKLNLNVPVLDLDGKEIKDSNIGKNLAAALASSNSGDALKLVFWAKKLHKGEPIELDPTDTQVLKDFVSNYTGFTNLFKSSVLELVK